jgi:hypothetical protein
MGWLMKWVLQFQGLYEKPTINNRRPKIYNTCIKKLVYAAKGHFMKACNLIIYKYSNIISL